MFCPKCGADNAPNTAFCANCGANLLENAAPQAQPQPQPQYAPPQQPYAQQQTFAPAPDYLPFGQQSLPISNAPVRSSDPVINALKNVCASPLLLVAVIAFTAATVLSIFSFQSLIGAAAGLIQQAGVDLGDYSGMIGMSRGYSIFAGASASLPTILIVLGLWMTYAAAASRGSNGMSTGGITLIRVIFIIQEIFVFIGFAVALVAIVVAMVAGGRWANELSSGGSAIAIGFGVGGLIVLAICAAFIIPYYVKIVKMLKEAKLTAQTGVTTGYASGYVGVITILSAIGSISNIVTMLAMRAWIAAAAMLCSCVASFCFGIFIFKVKNALKPFATGIRPQRPNVNPYSNGYGQPPQMPQDPYNYR